MKPIRRLPIADDANDRKTGGGCCWPKDRDSDYCSLPIDHRCRWRTVDR